MMKVNKKSHWKLVLAAVGLYFRAICTERFISVHMDMLPIRIAIHKYKAILFLFTQQKYARNFFFFKLLFDAHILQVSIIIPNYSNNLHFLQIQYFDGFILMWNVEIL